MKLSIIIPVYNEKNNILEILRKVDEVDFGNIQKEVVIIDDFSTDGTREIINNLAGNYKIIFGQNERSENEFSLPSVPRKYLSIFHNENQGKGSAIRTGLKVATGDYVVIQDADLEYDPSDLKIMASKMVAENLMVLYGSRRLKKDNIQYSGLLYYFGGCVLTVVANILYGQKLTDEPTCYKMFQTGFIKSLPLQCRRFEFCPEVTALTALRGLKITEIPISYYPRNKKEGKKIRWHDALVAIWVLLKYRLYLNGAATRHDFVKSNKNMRELSFGENKMSLLDKVIFFFRVRRIKKYLKNCDMIVDAGCGYSAPLLQWILNNFVVKRGVGLDISCAEGLAKGNLELMRSNFSEPLPLDDNTADYVISTAVMEHLSDPLFHIKEINRILKPGGKLLLTTPSKLAKPILEFLAFKLGVIDRHEIADHKQYFNTAELKETLGKCGFHPADIEAHTFLFGLNNFIIAKKYVNSN